LATFGGQNRVWKSMVNTAAVIEGTALNVAKEVLVARHLRCWWLLEQVSHAAEPEYGTTVKLRWCLTNNQFLRHKARSLNLSDIFSHYLIEVFFIKSHYWGLNWRWSRQLIKMCGSLLHSRYLVLSI